MPPLDELDLKIIERLQINGLESSSSLATELDTSEATIRRRRDALMANDVFRVVAVVDPLKLAFNIMVVIGIRVTHGNLDKVERAVRTLPEVRFLGVTIGSYDMMLEAWFKSTEELSRFLTDILAKIPQIERTETFQIIKLSKYAYDWGANGQFPSS